MGVPTFLEPGLRLRMREAKRNRFLESLLGLDRCQPGGEGKALPPR